MTKDAPTLRSWQFFAACLKVLGKTKFYNVFRVNEREAQRWGANPDHCGDIRKNPLDQLHSAMRELAILGRDDIAEAAPAMLARALGKRLVDIDPPEESDPRPLPQRFADAMALCAEYLRKASEEGRYEELSPYLEAAETALESIFRERRKQQLLAMDAAVGDVRFRRSDVPGPDAGHAWEMLEL